MKKNGNPIFSDFRFFVLSFFLKAVFERYTSVENQIFRGTVLVKTEIAQSHELIA